MTLLTPDIVAFLRAAGPKRFGLVARVSRVNLTISGIKGAAKLGDFLRVATRSGESRLAQIVSATGDLAEASSFSNFDGVAIGDQVYLEDSSSTISPGAGWLGRIVDPFGAALDGASLPMTTDRRLIEAAPPPAVLRKPLGARIATGLSVLDTLLPIVGGQRVGVFAGPGVGKSTLLAEIARGVNADVTVVALIGERSREVNNFADTLGVKLMERSVLVASTADQAPIAKKRGALVALAVAEHFRDAGKKVLLIFDSLTRFAEAHREVALAAGEPPTLHGYPPSTFRELASLVERAGPGRHGEGDITAVYSVLVEGGELESAPAADTIRGILDGHIILERRIAESGRFPAVDVLRSVSRALPVAASDGENALIKEARRIISLNEDAEMVVRAGLHTPGVDPQLDAALEIWPRLIEFLSSRSDGISESFSRLDALLHADETKIVGRKDMQAGAL